VKKPREWSEVFLSKKDEGERMKDEKNRFALQIHPSRKVRNRWPTF
jgi:hypothetical protein